jgi:polar amino acid transport system substrate-binding protein
MHSTRRHWLGSLALAAATWLSACSAIAPVVDPAARAALAPTGTLRVGVYMGNSTSLVLPRAGDKAGVAHDLGGVLARHLGVPAQVTEFARLALVLEALKAGQVDFTFTNATESRSRDVDFTPPLVKLELGYLTPPDSAITSVEQVGRAGVRVGVGVSEGSTSQGVLTRQFKQARLVPAASLKMA